MAEARERRARSASAAADSSGDWAGQTEAAFEALNARLGATTGGADLRILVPAALLVFGGYRMATAPRALPSWYELLWFSFSTFFTLSDRVRRDGSAPAARGAPPSTAASS
jgi:hypothetical protein